MIVADTPSGVARYQALAVKHGLLAIKAGFRVNRMYTPKACLFTAGVITGQVFKPRDYDGAIAALDRFIHGEA